MSQPNMSYEERKNYLKKYFYRKKLEDENQRLENIVYRKSFFFISTWVVRLLFIALFLFSWFFYDQSSGFQDEIVMNKSVENYLAGSRYRSYRGTRLHVETKQGNYSVTIGKYGIPNFSINDTVQIERSIVGRPIYFTKKNWLYKYSLDFNYFLYCMVLVYTCMTLLLNDGNQFTIRMIKIAVAINIFAIMLYFFL